MDINLCSTPSCYFQPLHVDTSVEYTLDDEKFPGLNESQHRAEPTLMVAPGYGQSYMSERKLADALWEESVEAQTELFDLLETVDLNEDYHCQPNNLMVIMPELLESAPEIGNGFPALAHDTALGDIIINSSQSASEMGNGVPISRGPSLGDNIPVLSQSRLELDDIPEVSHTIYQIGYNSIRPEMSRCGPEEKSEISQSASEVEEITPDLSGIVLEMRGKYDADYMDASFLFNDAPHSEDSDDCIESRVCSLSPGRLSDMDGDINLTSMRDRCRWDCMCSQKYGSTETCSWKRTLLPESETVEPAICWKRRKCDFKNGYCPRFQDTGNLWEYLHSDSNKTFPALQSSTKYYKQSFGLKYSPYTTPSIRQW